MNDTKTLSLCHICYKHIPAERITKNNAVYLIKTCPEHGRMEYKVEHDVEFYNNLEYDREEKGSDSTFFVQLIYKWGTWILIFTNFIPISLLVTLEMVKFV